MKDLLKQLRLNFVRPVFILTYAIATLSIFSIFQLGIDSSAVANSNLTIFKKFFAAALNPAFSYQARDLPPNTPPYLLKAGIAVKDTLLLSFLSISIALPLGIVFALLSAQTFWDSIIPASANPALRTIFRCLFFLVRGCCALLRSIHELIWAVLLLSAFGRNFSACVLAIAIPYSGVFGKVFSEMLDEVNKNFSAALKQSGADSVAAFIFGRLPLAIPNISAYLLYRFECAVRSSAVLGFFGFPTIGYYISASFENIHYREVWTYLYLMFGMILLIDLWSRRLRQRIVA